MGVDMTDRSNLVESLAADPYTSLFFHFGMLLGVDDFRTLAGNPRGKHRLHQAWQHGSGAVWGLAVSVDEAAQEVRVAPGLAIDGVGREVPVRESMCVNLPAWFAKHAEAPGFEVQEVDGELRFEAHVVAVAQPCLTRPVPAVSEACQGDDLGTAYSRIREDVALELRIQAAPTPAEPGDYPRIRLALGLRGALRDDADAVVAEDQAVLDRVAQARGSGDAASLRRALADLLQQDVMALRPASNLDGVRTDYPALPPAGVVLANLSVRLQPHAEGGHELAAPPEVDSSVRRDLAPTWLLQDGLLGLADDAVQRGPRVIPESFAVAGTELRFATTADLDGAAVQPPAFEVRSLGAGGWTPIGVAAAGLEGGDPRRVLLTLDAAPPAGRLRFIAQGSGPAPLVGADGTPLAGSAEDSRPSLAAEGRDFVHMHTVE